MKARKLINRNTFKIPEGYIEVFGDTTLKDKDLIYENYKGKWRHYMYVDCWAGFTPNNLGHNYRYFTPKR